MKKIFFILTILLTSAVCFSQQTSVVAKRVEAKDSIKINDRWINDVDDDTTLLDGQTRELSTSNAIYDFVTGRTLQLWQGLSDTAAAIRSAASVPSCVNKLITEWNVSWQGVGFNYTVHGGLSDGSGSYQILCVQYTADSATVTFDPADADQDRIDIIYLDATGVHVREGDLSAPGTAVRPTVDAEEILLTEILVAAGATTPTLTTLMVYDDNLGESTVSNTGTTTDQNQTGIKFFGAKAVNVSNINDPAGAGFDAVYFTKLPGLSTWNVLGFDALSLAIQLKSVMPTNANLGIALQVGTTTVGTEVIVPLVKTNITSFQQISVQLAAFGAPANTNITRVRFRYIRPSSGVNYTGFYLDYIYFVDGFSSGPSSGSFSNSVVIEGFTASPSSQLANGGTNTYTTTGTAGQYLDGSGSWLTFPTLVSTIGTLNGRTKSANGGVIDAAELFFQTVDATFPGLMTSAMFLKLDSNYYITNLGTYPNVDSLMRPVTANITGAKGLKDSTGIGFAVYPDYISIYATGGGGGTPNLLEVTNVGAFANNPIIDSAYFAVNPDYTSDFVIAMGFLGNGAEAMGAIDMREFSDGTGKLLTLQPVVDIGATDMTLQFHANFTGDTIAVLSDFRAGGIFSGGGGGGRFGVSGEDDVAGESRNFDIGTEGFGITLGDGATMAITQTESGGDFVQALTYTSQHLRMSAAGLFGSSYVDVHSEILELFSSEGAYVFSQTHTPSSASDTGITGQYSWDGSFIYICTATNTWKRVAIASW